MKSSPLPVTLFADFACPFCYVTEAALYRLRDQHQLELRARAFELVPWDAPRSPGPPEEDELRTASTFAAELGIEMLTPPPRPNTAKAHEAAVFAAQRGAAEALRMAIYEAYWTEGQDIGRIDVLLELAERVGLDPTDLKIALDIDLGRESVLADLALAKRLRITGIPTLFLGTGADATIVQGALSLSALDEALAVG